MDKTKTLKTTSGFSLGIGIIGIIAAVLILIVSIMLIGVKDDSPILQSLSSNQSFAQLSQKFAAEGYTDAEGIRITGIGVCVIGVFILICALFNVAKGVLGFKLANYGTCFSGAMVLGVITLIGDAFTLVLTLISGGNIIIKILYFAISVLYVYSVHGVKRETEERKMQEAISAINSSTVTTDDEAAKFFGN